ncbi:MAG: radical SAM protein [Candidatus Zixiibacteriota bacterium]
MSDFHFFPHTVVWEITFACNMRCIHCGTSAGKRRPDELSTQEALNLIDELTGLGCESITLSGGEPLMRDDWRQLAARVKDKGARLYMVTNGYALTPEIARNLAALQFNHVGVSLDGTEPVHNYIRQRDDSFARATDAMRYMREAGVRFCALTQVSNINLEELDPLHAILVDLGCKVWRIQMCTSTGRMKSHKDLVLSLDNYPKLIDKCLELKKATDITVDVGENIGYYGCKGNALLDDTPYAGCYAGVRIAGIESNGDVKGCLSMPEEFVEGNIRKKSFTEIWNNPNGFAYNRKFTRETASGACHDCRYLPLCRGGCATTSVSATGCRADNPYCIYRMEQAAGISAPEPNLVTEMLERYFPNEIKGKAAV